MDAAAAAAAGDERLRAYPATWDGVLAIVRAEFPAAAGALAEQLDSFRCGMDTAAQRARFVELEADAIRAAAPQIFTPRDAGGPWCFARCLEAAAPPSARFGYDELRAAAREAGGAIAPWQLRLFLLYQLRLMKEFSGEGFTAGTVDSATGPSE